MFGPVAVHRIAYRGDYVHDLHLMDVALNLPATKASHGHLLGGTGVVESIFSILAIAERTAPPTANLVHQDPEIAIDVVTESGGRALSGDQLVLSNSFGFGGHNAVIAFRSV